MIELKGQYCKDIKILMLLLIMFVFSTSLMAQKKTEHFRFLNIPICGTVENFTKQIENKGFRKVKNTDFFRGVYDNDSVLVIIISNSRLNFVYGVNVILGFTKDRKSLLTLKNTLVQRFVNKYNSEEVDLEDDYNSSFVPYVKGNITIGAVEIGFAPVGDTEDLHVKYYDINGLNKNTSDRDRDL